MEKDDPYKKYVLPNGLTAITYNLHGLMASSIYVYVKVGPVYENKITSGLSHFTEHLPFLGTKKYPKNKNLEQATKNMGAYYNAYTGRTETSYFINLPFTEILKGIDLLYELVFNPLLREKDLESEKKVVLSEYQDYWQIPDNQFNNESWERRFKQKDHPYTIQAFGTPDNIKGFTKKNVLDWRNKYYNPNNMVIAVSGNMDEKMVKREILNTFGKEKSKKVPSLKRQKLNDYSDFSIYYHKLARPQTSFYIDYPAFGNKEISREKLTASLLLASILYERLREELRERKKLLYRFRVHNNYFQWAGVMTINGSVSKEDLIICIETINKTISTIKEKGISKKELQIHKNYFNKSDIMKIDSPNSINRYLALQAIDYEEVFLPKDYIKLTNKITADEINDLARQILNNKKVNISIMGNHSEKEITTIKKIFRS